MRKTTSLLATDLLWRAVWGNGSRQVSRPSGPRCRPEVGGPSPASHQDEEHRAFRIPPGGGAGLKTGGPRPLPRPAAAAVGAVELDRGATGSRGA